MKYHQVIPRIYLRKRTQTVIKFLTSKILIKILNKILMIIVK
jgi:hypothetical protein